MRATIKVDCGCGGNVVDAFEEMIRLAKALSVCVESEINGVVCIVFPDTSPGEMYDAFMGAVDRKQRVAVA